MSDQKPSELPEWDTDEVNIVEPNASRKANGWATNAIPPSGEMNWWQWLVWSWCVYLDTLHTEVQFLNKTYGWTALHTFGAGISISSGNLALTSGDVSARDATFTRDVFIGDDLGVAGDASVAGTFNASGAMTTGSTISAGGAIYAAGSMLCTNSAYIGVGSGSGFRYSSDGTIGGQTYVTRTITLPLHKGVPSDEWVKKTDSSGNMSWELPGAALPTLEHVKWSLAEYLPVGAHVVSVSSRMANGQTPSSINARIHIVGSTLQTNYEQLDYSGTPGGTVDSWASGQSSSSSGSSGFHTTTFTINDPTEAVIGVSKANIYVIAWGGDSSDGSNPDEIGHVTVTYRDWGQGIVP